LFIFFNVKESNDQGRSRECRFGSKCSRADCYFSHPTGWSANDVRKRQMEESQQMCRFGSDCHRKTCHYNHPPDRNMKMESYHRERELEKKKMKLEVERNQREHLRTIEIQSKCSHSWGPEQELCNYVHLYQRGCICKKCKTYTITKEWSA